MGLDVSGVGTAITGIKDILGMFFPDKTQEERDKLAAALQLAQQAANANAAQTDIDKAEAQSTDPLQHWRGGLGWVCVVGYAYAFLVQPLGHAWFPQLQPLDIGQLSTLTLGMLGLGGLHVAERIKGVS